MEHTQQPTVHVVHRTITVQKHYRTTALLTLFASMFLEDVEMTRALNFRVLPLIGEIGIQLIAA